MKEKWKNFLMNPWTVTIGSSLIISAISVIYDLANKKQIFSTMITVLKKICDIFQAILNYRIRVWWLMLGIIILILLIVLYSKYVATTMKKQNEPDFLEYMQDMILGYKWRWKWEKDYYGKYNVAGLYPICSRCGTPLVENHYGYGGKYKCLRCEEWYSKPLPDFDHVEMLIKDNVRRKYFHNE